MLRTILGCFILKDVTKVYQSIGLSLLVYSILCFIVEGIDMIKIESIHNDI